MKLRKAFDFILLAVALLDFAHGSIIGFTNITNIHAIRRRSLAYYNGGTMKVLVGFSVPMKISEGRSIGVANNVQFQYALPKNFANLSNIFTGVTFARKRRAIERTQDSTRKIAYTFLETLLDRRGLDGEACLLRLICEEAENPLHTNDLMSQMVHIILTPNLMPAGMVEPMDGKYTEAQIAGTAGVDCHSLYSTCAFKNNLLDLLTTFGGKVI